MFSMFLYGLVAHTEESVRSYPCCVVALWHGVTVVEWISKLTTSSLSRACSVLDKDNVPLECLVSIRHRAYSCDESGHSS